MSDEEVVIDRGTSRRSFWPRHRLQVQIAVLGLAALGLPIADSIGYYFGHQNDGPITGSPIDIPSAYILLAIETLTVCALAFAWVTPRELGFFAPREERRPTPQWISSWMHPSVYVYGLAHAWILLTVGVLSGLLLDIGIPGNLFPPSDPWWDLPWILRAGLYEEIPIAAMVVLMLRANWNTASIMLVIGGLRVAYHIYQGAHIIIPDLLFGIGFVYLFIKYRRVGPLIAAHTLYGLSKFALAVV